MNVLEEVIIKSPNNIDEKCGKFTIDDVTDPFILSSITRSGEHYMFSAWIKSSVAGTVSIYGEKINTTTEWSKYEIGFSSNGNGVNILFEVSATYYFYHSKLEIGNKATDWTPAPEDVDSKIETNTKLIQDINGWQMIWDTILNKDNANTSAYQSYITFADGTIELGNSSNDMKTLIDNDSVDFIRSGVTIASFSDESVIGLYSGRHMIINSGGLSIYNGSTVIGQIGYGEGNSSGDAVSNAPYYTFGERNMVEGIGNYSTAEGYNTSASSYCSHAEGCNTLASGSSSHAEGSETTATGFYSHAEGCNTIASGLPSHAEGYYTNASGESSHAEGSKTTASGNSSHAEGSETTASGNSSHAEGSETTASGLCSHAGGRYTEAGGCASCAIGDGTIANADFQMAIGKYNKLGSENDVFIIGNGTGPNSRSNALRVTFDGKVFSSGDMYPQGTKALHDGRFKTSTQSITTDHYGQASLTRPSDFAYALGIHSEDYQYGVFWVNGLNIRAYDIASSEFTRARDVTFKVSLNYVTK